MIHKTLKDTVLLLGLVFSISAFADYPVALQDKFTVRQSDRPMYLSVLKNDSGLSLQIDSSNNWTQKGGRTSPATISHTSTPDTTNRLIKYTPPGGFVGDDEFWYVIKDDQGRSNAAKVIVTVLPYSGNLAQDDEVFVPKNTSITIDVNDNDVRESEFQDAYVVDWNNWSEKGGQIKSDFLRNKLIYTPPQGFVGKDTFWYSIQDPRVFEATFAAKVTVNVTEYFSGGPYPIGKPDRIKVRTSENPTYHPLDNDIGRGLKFASETAGGRYSLRGVPYGLFEATGSIVGYKPPPGLTGEDKVWYTFEDELGRSNYGEITFLLGNN